MPRPAYKQLSNSEPTEGEEVPMQVVNDTLPAYYDTTTLPSYTDVQNDKRSKLTRSNAAETPRPSPSAYDMSTRAILGTNGSFAVTFLVSFFLNGIGLLISLCFSRTIAGRCGAVSGFGLALVKIAAFFYHYCQIYSNNSNNDLDVSTTTSPGMMIVAEENVFVSGNTTLVEVDALYLETTTPAPVATTFFYDVSDPSNQQYNIAVTAILCGVGFFLFASGIASYMRAKASFRRSAPINA